MTRQQRFQQLVDAFWRTGMASPDGTPGSSERGRVAFESAQRDLANYIAQNARRITVASDPPKRRRGPGDGR
jgi:hypothetical protein